MEPDISTRTPAGVSITQRVSDGRLVRGAEDVARGTKVSAACGAALGDELVRERSLHRHQMSVLIERLCFAAKVSALWPLRSQRSMILRHSVAFRRRA